MLHWSLLSGAFPILLVIIAGVGAAFLLARHGRKRWWTVTVPSIVGGSALVAMGIAWYVDHIWQPFPDAFPGEATVWIAVILACLALTVATIARKTRWGRRVVAVVALLVIVAAGLNDVNRIYGYYPTLAAVIGMPVPGQMPLPPLHQADSARTSPAGVRADRPIGLPHPGDPPVRRTSPVATHLSGPLIASWRPTQPVPRIGAISEVQIPGVASRFAARPAWVYLPPAYLMAPRPNLPVLMLLSGQPGGPKNWVDAGHVQTTMDAFAARHRGLAPIVVMPDPNGSYTGNTLCMNSDLGQADTYLSRDVPGWIDHHLQVDRDMAHWAVGGFSYGGTCSFQLAVTHPTMFQTFLDISGGTAPTLGSRARDLSLAFHGDVATYRARQPLNILAADHAHPATARELRLMAATFVAGTSDHRYTPQQHTVMRACERDGITAHWLSEPGSHAWYIASAALNHEVGWLAGRMSLT